MPGHDVAETIRNRPRQQSAAAVLLSDLGFRLNFCGACTLRNEVGKTVPAGKGLSGNTSGGGSVEAAQRWL